MKILTTITRILLGLLFLTFGLNGFFQFLHMPPPTGTAAQFFGALDVSHYLRAIFAVQLLGGVLLLVNRFVPLALTMLAAVIVNILVFHITMAPEGLPLAFATTALWAVTFWGVRRTFAPLFAAQAAT